MTLRATQYSDGFKSFNYAESRRQKRLLAAVHLSKRVKNPVVKDTDVIPEKRLPEWIGGGGFLLAALLAHSALVGVLFGYGDDTVVSTRSDKVVFQVVESEPLPVVDRAAEPAVEPVPDIIAEPEPESEPESEPPQLVRRENKVTAKRTRMARADPVNQREAEIAAAPKRRAVVGIELSSTVQGGAGPAYAVGNTRMGGTASVQSQEKIEKLTKGRQSGEGGANGGAQVNRKATFVPTVRSDFKRPERLQPVALPYPSELKSKGIEGNVVVLIVIDEQGAVQRVRILKSSGYREFDEAALRAAKKEMYSPAKRDGKAVEYNLKYTYRFRMKGA